MQFQVPQFIDVEDKIVGPLSFKQFAYILAAGATAFIGVRVFPLWLGIPLALPLIGFFLALAFLKINGRPFIYAVESQGAQIVNLEEYSLGVAVVLKSDGGTTYLLRDLATFIFRQKQGFEKQIYVVDVRQKHTLSQTLKIVELLGYLKNSEEALHVAYGFLTLPEGARNWNGAFGK
jgi:hypothetical protein